MVREARFECESTIRDARLERDSIVRDARLECSRRIASTASRIWLLVLPPMPDLDLDRLLPATSGVPEELGALERPWSDRRPRVFLAAVSTLEDEAVSERSFSFKSSGGAVDRDFLFEGDLYLLPSTSDDVAFPVPSRPFLRLESRGAPPASLVSTVLFVREERRVVPLLADKRFRRVGSLGGELALTSTSSRVGIVAIVSAPKLRLLPGREGREVRRDGDRWLGVPGAADFRISSPGGLGGDSSNSDATP
eukprot:Nitzschia sp. Nitz4//scaffold202_size38995//1416//2168//NITZ4_007623-RA/size38995-exonerate_est2genome-gene-0.18-mRNA-1//-1//CDS//3329541357//136//frame0